MSPTGAHAAIDCSAQQLRGHPKSADYHRGDKRIYMVVSQMVVGLNGEVYKVAIGKGHNNDKKYLILLA